MKEASADPVNRADVERWWLDAMSGRCSPDDAYCWAISVLETFPDVEELVLQGVLTVQSFVHHKDEAALREYMKVALERWREQLVRYDADPEAWMRRYFQELLIRFADRHGLSKARAFGARLVAHGQLGQDDVDAALGVD